MGKQRISSFIFQSRILSPQTDLKFFYFQTPLNHFSTVAYVNRNGLLNCFGITWGFSGQQQMERQYGLEELKKKSTEDLAIMVMRNCQLLGHSSSQTFTNVSDASKTATRIAQFGRTGSEKSINGLEAPLKIIHDVLF